MSTQYRCSNENRRDAVRFTTGADGKPILNGMDYLEIVSPDEMTLEVHFVHNLPGETDGVPATGTLTALNFVIEGGARIQSIKVKTLSVADNVVTLHVNEAGDYSRYILRAVTAKRRALRPAASIRSLRRSPLPSRWNAPAISIARLKMPVRLKPCPRP